MPDMMPSHVAHRFIIASIIASITCLLSLVALPTGRLLIFPDALALLLALIIAGVAPFVIRQGVRLAAFCVGVSVSVLVTLLSETDFLGCATVDAMVARSVCMDDAGFRQFPPFFAAFLLLVRLVIMGVAASVRGLRKT